MKITVVTISFNQGQFLEACIDSVSVQEGPWEHIIVDPGSTDGSREIINKRREQFAHIILTPDDGPADGLNKGFACASGEVFYYLNSDDIVSKGAFAAARAVFEAEPYLDVISGHADIIDEMGRPLRKVYSDPISRHRLAFGGGMLIQPATFIRRKAFERAGGFNVANRSNWDGELVTDLMLTGARFGLRNQVWGGYRLHEESITATGKLSERIKLWSRRRYEKIMGRAVPSHAGLIRRLYQFDRVIRHPDLLLARLAGRRVYGAKRK